MKKYKAFRLAIAIIGCELAGAVGSLFTAPAIPGWYSGLIKPAINPPAWIFGPVWTILFALMGVAAWIVWEKGNRPERGLWPDLGTKEGTALAVFISQLALNILWSIIFFGWHAPGAAFAEIIFLWLAIAATILAFWRVSKKAAGLLVPYLIWVSFAAYLNYLIWTLNG
jgi:tryptophan-rich sensory protein